MSLPRAAERAAAWLAPLPGASPFGTDVRHEPEHEAIRSEVAKLDSPASAAQINWKKVADGGTALLSSRSKDFLIAAYTAHALHEQESLSGLLAGLLLLNGLLDAAWEGMFPPPARIKGRVAALQWFIDRASARLASNGAGTHDAAELDALDAALQRLGELTRARFAADAPTVQILVSGLARLRSAAPAAGQAAPAPAPATVTGSESVTESVSDSVSVPDSDSDSVSAPESVSASPEDTTAAQRTRMIEAVSAWLEPISADERAGKDARYDPLHEEVRAMIKQLDSPLGGVIEWKKLVSRTETLLKQRSKDLLIATYAAYGMYQQTGLSGLADGIALLAALLERYWDDLFPDTKRSHKARAGAVSWLLPRFATLGERAVGPADAVVVARLAEAARWFADEVTTRFDYDHRPALRPFLEQIERLEVSVQVPAASTPQPDPAAARPSPSAGAPAAAVATSAQPTTVAVPQNLAAPGGAANRDDVTRYLATLREALNDMGKGLRNANPKDPLAYLLPRVGAALELDELPPSQNGRTFIPSISALELQELKGMLREQSWDALLSGAEGAAANRPLAFDLQRFVHTALRQLGGGYDACRLVVEGELAALLKRLPGVLELAHGNGTPFADPDTQAWIRAEILAGSGGGASASASAAGDDVDGAALAAARALALAGNTGEALAAFDAVLYGARSGRARFGVRLAMARAVLAAGDAQLASGLFSALYDEIERRGLDEWEPELAADCLAGYHECLSRGLAKSPEMAQRSAVVYARLCRVDPRRALKASQ